MHRTYQTTIPHRPEMLNIIRAAFDRGVTFFDTAEAYGPHECERILGEGITPFRDQVVITSKFGWNIDLETGERRPGLNSRPEHIKLAVEGCSSACAPTASTCSTSTASTPQVPIEDVAGAIKDLMDQGKVLHWGLSEMGLNTLRRAHAALPVTAVQSEYSMLWRGPEQEVIPLCEELGIGFVPWSPLGVGFLTGAIDAQDAVRRRRHPRRRGPLCAGEPAAQPRAGRAGQDVGRAQAGHSRADRARLADGAEALDRADPRHHADGAHARQHRRRRRPVHAEEIAELNAAVRAIEVRGERLPDAVLVFSGVEAPEES